MDRPEHLREDLFALLQAQLPFMHACARRIAQHPQDAEDLVHDVLLKLLQQPAQATTVQDLRPWLTRVLYHHWIDLMRRRALLREVPMGALSPPESGETEDHGFLACAAAGPEELAQHDQLHGLLAGAIRRLPRAQREVLQWHELDGLTLSEIARRQGVPINTLKSALTRGRLGLRRHLQQQLAGGAAHRSLLSATDGRRRRRRRKGRRAAAPRRQA